MHIENYYKYDEIKEYFNEVLAHFDKDTLDKLIKDNELHHEVFNTDYYIIGTYRAKKWLSDEVFNIINITADYENDHIRHNKGIFRGYCWLNLILWAINSINAARYIIKHIEG